MTAQLTKIKNSDAEAIVMWTAGAEAATIAKNVKDLGIDLPFFGSHGIARREFIEGAGDAAEGVKFAAGKVLIPEAYGEGTEAFTVATDFIDRYTAAFGDAPSTFAGHAYDALYIIVEARSASTATSPPEALRDEIEATAGFVGYRRHVQLLADRPQRHDRGRPHHVRDQGRRLDAGPVAARRKQRVRDPRPGLRPGGRAAS